MGIYLLGTTPHGWGNDPLPPANAIFGRIFGVPTCRHAIEEILDADELTSVAILQGLQLRDHKPIRSCPGPARQSARYSRPSRRTPVPPRRERSGPLRLLSPRAAPERGRGRGPAQRDAATGREGKDRVQENSLTIAKESLELAPRQARAPFYPGSLEYTRCPSLLPQGSFSAFRGLPSAGSGRTATATLDAFGNALSVGALQRTGSEVARSSRWGACWTRLRVSNGAPEGMNNKIKLVSHRSFGFWTVKNFTAAIYHCCAHPPLPEES